MSNKNQKEHPYTIDYFFQGVHSVGLSIHSDLLLMNLCIANANEALSNDFTSCMSAETNLKSYFFVSWMACNLHLA